MDGLDYLYAVKEGLIPPGMNFTSPEIRASCFRPVASETGTLRCEGTVTHRGTRFAVPEFRILDSTGRLYAQAMSTFMLFKEKR
jgi:acyl-coenzyme A thioesterase PaaI-like protein